MAISHTGRKTVVTHYGVIAFSGDPAGVHPDPELNGQPPSLTMIAAGPEHFCWGALTRWTAEHPMLMWQTAEVLKRTGIEET